MKKQPLLSTLFFILSFTISSTINAQFFTHSGAEAYLIDSCYPAMGFQLPWGISSSLVSNISSDDAWKGGNTADDLAELEQIEKYEFEADNKAILNAWNFNYMLIERANKVLSNIDREDSQFDRAFAEASFLRAYAYFNLVRRFGGVPLVDYCRPYNTSLVRNTKQEVYDYIITDLTAASPLLPQKSGLATDEKYRVTRGAALGLLAKVYLYTENWAAASVNLDLIISSYEYELLSDFSALWLEENEHNEESIFEFEYNDDIFLTWQNYSNFGNLNIQMMGIRSVDDSIYADGFGFVTVDTSLVEAFQNAGDSARLYATVVFADSIYSRGGTINTNNQYEFTGFYNAKYIPKNSEIPANLYVWRQNEVVLRYADILLMNAEAKFHLGDEVNAREYLNQVRQRAYLPQTFAGGGNLIDAIYNERRLELALEGERYFDLIRWGKGAEVFASMGFVTDKHEVWPIPQQVLFWNPEITQNVGYDNVMVTIALNLAVNNPVSVTNFPKNRQIADSAYIYTYNACRNDSILTGKALYTVENNTITSYIGLGYSRVQQQWINYSKEGYIYDSDRNLTSRSSYSYDSEFDLWDLNMKSEYTYRDGKMTSFILYVGNDSIPSQKIEYSWNDEGDIEYGSFYFYNSNQFVRQSGMDSKREYIYNSDGLITTGTYSNGDSTTNDWNAWSKDVFTYDDHKNVSSHVIWSWNGDEFVFNTEYSFISTYGTQGEFVSSLTKYRSVAEGEFMNYASYNTSYTEDAFVSTSQSYTFNPYFENTVMNTTTPFIYGKKSYTGLESTKSDNGNSLTVYPNPTQNGFVTIKNQNNTSAEILVYTINGSLLKSYQAETGESECFVGNSGIYIIKMVSDGKVFNTKLIVE